MKRQPLIALLTDFGMSDGYVAAMKGTILSINPAITIVDISHSIEPHNVRQAAFLLWTVYKYFPEHAIFVCVVDPGVGSLRKIICVEGNDYCFLAPDNGILKYILGILRKPKVYQVTNKKLFQQQVSSTFHGRDIFAPVAAWLAGGKPVKSVGAKYTPQFGAEHFITINPHQGSEYEGVIVHVDHFGNMITNILIPERLPRSLKLKIGHRLVKRYFPTYANADIDEPFMIRGSSGLLEVSVKQANAAKLLGVNISQKIYLEIS
ncbi:MAG: SAM-dependent chlorinase/fluorinase [Ignavibacteria bacterium]|nr:SAM-dependent chlorinase/fluorinase [Ignavibacteria bacterium]MBI3766603.1 SAM-dependent chlorinase/fluorinase [Ignavibacteriales bacterium]